MYVFSSLISVGQVKYIQNDQLVQQISYVIIKFLMSAKKQQKKEDKKKGKNKQKDLQKERIAQEQARKQQQRQEALDRIAILEKSGLLDGYENLLRAICKNGLPETNIFQFAAQQMLKYQKKMKVKQAKRSELQKSPQRQASLEKHKPISSKQENKQQSKPIKK